MRRILVKSLNEAFDFVMDHYYPAGCEEDAKRKDTYAVISIQDLSLIHISEPTRP